MDAVGDENFGAVLDTGHQHAQKEILPLSVEKLGSRIFYLHVSDNDGLVNEHLALGEGTVDWTGVFIALKKHGFDGYVALDIGHVSDLDGAMLRSRRFLLDLLPRLGISVEG
jgi:sugar phosphate isomerase/epimerase